MKLHPKIQALRSSVGSSPIHYFHATKEVDEARSAKTEDRKIKMYHAVFGVPDDYGTVPVRGCFAKSIEERGPASKAHQKIVVLWQHDQRDPLCIPSVIKEDDYGLYAEYEPDPVPSGDRCVTQVRSGTINQGSYGFNYVWDKMDYDDATGLIMMRECNTFELSPVTFASQKETHAVRSKEGFFVDQYLDEETEDFIKSLPRKQHLELRALIERHITLAKLQPLEQRQKALDKGKPKQAVLDINYLIKNL